MPANAIAVVGVLIGALLAVLGGFQGEAGEVWKAAGLGVAAITLFATRAVPEIVTAFAIFLSALALGMVPREIVFSGFFSGGFWLLVSGIILGAAITATGLAARISERLLALTGPSYARAVLVIATAGMALGVLIPSTMPRIVVMVPIAAALAESLGLKPNERAGFGLIATAATATLLPTYAILTANLPTIVHVGTMDQLYGAHSTYSGYLLQQWPVNLLRFTILLALMVGFSRDPIQLRKDAVADHGPMPREQRRLLWVLSGAILLWMTDFVHGVAPAWIALAAATIVVWPRFGMMGPKAMREQIDLSPAIFMASIITVVAVARAAGLDGILANFIIASLPWDASGGLASVYSVYGLSLLLSHLTTAPAAPTVLVPFAAALTEATGLSLDAVSMAQVIGISTPLIPYQAPPLIVAMALSKVPTAYFLRLCLGLASAVTLVGVPLTYAWWKLMGLV